MSSQISPLSLFLARNRSRYLDALNMGKSHEWTVVVGNEAGDLDSAASSIAYSYLASMLLNQPTVALLQTPRTDLHLRAENIYAYQMARLHPNQTDLLCIDDIPAESLPHISASSFALVDHNHLDSRFSQARDHASPPKVVAIIDHHDDENHHEEAKLRLITVPVGSCASLVTQYFMEAWKNAEPEPPGELASLLLCAIYIDTQGLKAGGKAVPLDHGMVEFLLPKSTWTSTSGAKSLGNREELQMLIQTLHERKQSVSHLSSRDLLRRDYKEYRFETTPYSSHGLTVGMATVPLSPKEWLSKEGTRVFWQSVDAWIEERKLDALGILCTYHAPKSGRHKRKNLWVVRHGHKDLMKTLSDGMEECEELQLKRRHVGASLYSEGVNMQPDGGIETPHGSVARIWIQGNTKATRKVIAPLVKRIITGS